MQRFISIGDAYSLTEAEKERVKAVARARTTSNRGAGVNDAGIGPSSGVSKDMIGCGAEFAFAHLIQSNFDETIEPRSVARGEDEGDTAYRGIKIDVKGTHYPNGKLVVAPWHQGRDQGTIYALMIMTDRTPTFVFKGFALPNFVYQFPSDLGHGPTFAVPQERLAEWWHLDAFNPRCQEHEIIVCLDCGDPHFG